MKQLSNSELLGIWEAHLRQSAIERSLYLLSFLFEKDINTVAGMTIGERDAGLLRFRDQVFGPKLINFSRCPHCDTPIEWESDIKDLLFTGADPEKSAKVFRLEKDGLAVGFRLPNSFDIMEAYQEQHKGLDPSSFISKCIISAVENGLERDVKTLPPEIIALVEQQMSEEDPQADLKMVMTCPECSNLWEAPFDIVSYLWLELDNWAKRLLQEIAVLAKAFGWTEREILSLSPQRRQLYLQMIS